MIFRQAAGPFLFAGMIACLCETAAKKQQNHD